MANRSMAGKILKAKKETMKEMTESANNFSCTRAFRDTKQSKYDWFGTKPYSTAKQSIATHRFSDVDEGLCGQDILAQILPVSTLRVEMQAKKMALMP